MTDDIKDWVTIEDLYKPERWGCPDWRDRAAYPSSIDSLQDWQWRWEFLRRVQPYRFAWHYMKEKPSQYLLNMNLQFWDLVELIDPRIIPEENPFVGLTKPGLYHLPESEVFEYYNSLPIEDRFNELIEDLKEGRLLTDEPETNLIQYAIFDLTRPLNDQLLETERMLKERLATCAKGRKHPLAVPKPHLQRAARKNWIRHIRVLDAFYQDATKREIWDVLKTEEIQSRPDCPDIDSETLEILLDREVYSPKKTNLVGPTVDGWIKNARTKALTVGRHLLHFK